jgi:drug/metabolite transporter (DMT)-like permease
MASTPARPSRPAEARQAPAAGSALLPRLQVLGAALLFSTGGAAIKACSLSAWQVAGFRSAVAAAALLIALPAARARPRPRTLAVGAAYAATLILFVTANKLTTAANTIFLQSTAPIYLLLLGPWLLGERVRRADLAMTAALGLGLASFFVGSDPHVATAPEPLRGNVLAAASGFTWALTIVGLRGLGRGDASADAPGAVAAVVAGNLIAFAVCLPPAWPVAASTPLDWAVIGYLGVFQIGLAYVLLTRGVRRLPALEVSLLILVEPVLNAVWAFLIHGERPGPWSAAGCTLILVATAARVAAGRRSSTAS